MPCWMNWNGEMDGGAAVGRQSRAAARLGLFRMREIERTGCRGAAFRGAFPGDANLFPQADNLLLVARQISILAIMATGMTFLFISREIDLSVGSIYGFLAVMLAYPDRQSGT